MKAVLGGPKKLGRFLLRLGSTKTAVEAEYKLLGTIGKGSFSTVKLARVRSSGELVAIKIVKKKKSQFRQAELERELAVLGAVRHPFIVALREYHETGKEAYLIMQYAAGGEVFDRLATQGAYTEAEARTILAQVLDAVAHLHSLGIAHRDLKPENLLYASTAPDSPVLLADFGFSRFAPTAPGPGSGSGSGSTPGSVPTPGSGSTSGSGSAAASTIYGNSGAIMRTACGTLSYCAPEIVRGEGYTDRVDIWSMGVIAFVLLGGYGPFDDDRTDLTTQNILEARFSFPDANWAAVSLLAKDFIRTLLQLRPEKRPSAQQALLHPWFQAADHELASASRSSQLLSRYNARRKMRRALMLITASNALNRAAAKSAEDESPVFPQPHQIHHSDAQSIAQGQNVSIVRNMAGNPSFPDIVVHAAAQESHSIPIQSTGRSRSPNLPQSDALGADLATRTRTLSISANSSPQYSRPDSFLGPPSVQSLSSSYGSDATFLRRSPN
eukprot:TRINITY_DN6288_c0_g1_i6.p1 TRINITY_DN6288_c0_g1~~TRINITY_DN6288_c0_g1_i6.p1  ORF type:complete len:498 (+),score=126.06 TRINITY_DN6288_c0_g1_i6:52-1545(+)